MDDLHGTRTLAPRERWLLVLLGGVLGAVIGPAGFWLRGIDATERLRERTGSTGSTRVSHWDAAFAAIGTSSVQLGFMLIAGIATAALTPTLVRWLERRAHHETRAFYPRAAVAGLGFGVAATMVTAMGIFIVMLAIGTASADPSTSVEDAGGLVLGAGTFAPLVAIVAPFFFLKWIALFGVPFGLLFGRLVRWLLRRG